MLQSVFATDPAIDAWQESTAFNRASLRGLDGGRHREHYRLNQEAGETSLAGCMGSIGP